MTDQILLARLKPAVTRLRAFRTVAGGTIGFALGALLIVGVLLISNGESFPVKFGNIRVALLVCGVVLGLMGALIGFLMAPSAAQTAKKLEAQFPDLEGRLITALQQSPDEKGQFQFLQEHLFTETLRHSSEQNWSSIVSDSSLLKMRIARAAVIAVFAFLLTRLPSTPVRAVNGTAISEADENGVSVTPGDTELEKGSNLVLLAKFQKEVPGAVDVVLGESAASEKRVTLKRSLSDPVFGGTVDDVQESFKYRVAWEGGKTNSYQVKVFEYPKLERSDVTLTFPDYTKLPVKHVEDMRHTSAVEGTRLDLQLMLNKPVASAVLEPKKGKDAKEGDEPVSSIKLETSPDKAVAALRGFVPVKSGRYELVLTDTDGRHSRQPATLSFEVVPNKMPEMKLITPKGDQKPSALQELTFTGTVWDDFGVVASGLEVTTPGGQSVTLDFGKDVPGRETRAFQNMLKLEELKAAPDQLFAWHTWADDIGPDGKIRRTRGDLFYAEVRAFEEIFRQGDGMQNQEQQQQEQDQQQNEGQGAATKLAELQKQIINATWKLQRAQAGTLIPGKVNEDIKIVRDSQADAKSQAQEAAEKAGDQPQTAANWQTVLLQMQQAVERLEKATAAPMEVATALAPEQSAYQALLKLRATEHKVSQSQKGKKGQPSENEGSEQQQQQLNQMDLAKEEDRYETKREAQAQQSAERREQMQVLNRLKELAQRQQDVNEKLKELQTALNEAKTEKEKEDAKRELKRLEEEQRGMLADADELSQKMEQRQNQSEAGEQQQKLDEARQNMEQAADATAKGEASKALAAGAKAKEQMQQMREEMRKQSAGAFADELRDMRNEAREIAKKQEDITKQLKPDQADASNPTDPKITEKPAPSLGENSQESDVAKALDKQEQRTEELIKRATELSEEAEPSEPLLSKQIYETARQFAQDDVGAVKETQQTMLRDGQLTESQFQEMRRLMESEQSGKALNLTAQMLRQNDDKQAAKIAGRAKEGLDKLRQGMEKAAESVLGDDTAAIRQAESQLQAATEAVQKEIQQQKATAQASKEEGRPAPQNGEAKAPGNGENKPETSQSQQQGEPKPGEQAGGKGQGEVAQQQKGQQPGKDGEGQQPVEGKGQARGEGKGEGQGEGSQPGEPSESSRTAQARGENQRGPRQPQSANGGGGGGGPQQDFETRGPNAANRTASATASPLTGNGFTNWSDALREAEEMVDLPELRNGIASARERARQMRGDMKRGDLQKPDWAVVELEILKPLVEVRQRLREELARRDSDKALVPVDRDPVPAQFTETVRRYYEQLGKDQ